MQADIHSWSYRTLYNVRDEVPHDVACVDEFKRSDFLPYRNSLLSRILDIGWFQNSHILRRICAWWSAAWRCIRWCVYGICLLTFITFQYFMHQIHFVNFLWWKIAVMNHYKYDCNWLKCFNIKFYYLLLFTVSQLVECILVQLGRSVFYFGIVLY